MTAYETIIGLETHIQLNTLTKIFCACKADSWEDAPNSNICPVCSGLPGVLPVCPTAHVVEKAVLLARCHERRGAVRFHTSTARTTFTPTCPRATRSRSTTSRSRKGGYLDVPIPAAADPQGKGYVTRVHIEKLHIEEDAGKTKNWTNGERLIDFNRCGVPLIEMVTGPDLRSADEAAEYLVRLRQLLRWLDVSPRRTWKRRNLRCRRQRLHPSGEGASEVLNDQDRDQERQLDRLRARSHL